MAQESNQPNENRICLATIQYPDRLLAKKALLYWGLGSWYGVVKWRVYVSGVEIFFFALEVEWILLINIQESKLT